MLTIQVSHFFYNFVAKYRYLPYIPLNMKLNKSHFLFGLGLLALGVTSCKKDDVVFNQNTYNDLLVQAFPVKNVDPSQTWTTVGTATAEITVNGDYGEDYKVNIYLDNPMSETVPTKVFTGSVNSGNTLYASLSYKLAQPYVYIGIFDKVGRRVFLNAPVENGKITAVYGAGAVNKAARRVTEAETATYGKTLNDYLNPAKDPWGNTLNTYQLTVDAMKEFTALTDADLVVGSTCDNLTINDRQYNAIQGYIAHGDGKHYRIPANTELRTVFKTGNYTSNMYNEFVIYVEGKLHINGNNFGNTTIVVADGGEIIIDGDENNSGTTRFVIMPGGKMTGTAGKLWSNNNGSYCYNAGTIDFAGILNLNGTNFYNNGIVNVDVLTGTAGNTKFINFGKITARTNSYSGSSYNQTWVNGCYVHFTENAGMGTSVLLSGSRFDIDGNIDVLTGTIDMHNQSELKCDNLLKLNGATFNGPTTVGEYAIVKTNKLFATWSGSITANGFTYFDFDPDEIYGKDGDANKNYKSSMSANDYMYSAAYGIVNTQIRYWVNEENALNDIMIPEGCAGTGFNPNGNSGDKEPDDTPLSMRFLFEDNFPDAGDYDFNDCVFTVTPKVDENDAKKVTVAVRLEATGASKTNGAAIRLVGITEAMLTSKSVANALPKPEDDGRLANYNYHLPAGDFTISQDPNDNSSLVLLLCKDVHYALNTELGSDGTVQRKFYNTCGDEGWNNYGQADPKTVTYTFVFNNETDAQKMLDQATYDAFIVEEFNGGTWEVHTVQNDRKGALVLPGNEFQFHRNNYQAYKDTYVNNEKTGNFPWAVMVPGTVAYPLEGRNVKTAYPKFESWAQNHTVNTDWYNSPSSGDVHAIP